MLFCLSSTLLSAQQCGEQNIVPKFPKASAPLQIADWAWTKTIQKSCPTQRLEKGQKQEAPVYLWMKIVGGKKALKTLRKKGRLSLRHIWIKEDEEGQVIKKEVVQLDKKGTKGILKKFSLELKTNQFFDWRTWSVKHNLSPGLWRVQVVDNAGKPIPCVEGLDCTFNLQINDAPYLIHQENIHEYLDLPSIHFKF